MAKVRDALALARTFLNDDAALVWNTSVLMPKLRQAHLELETAFALNGIPVSREATTAITIPAGAVDMGVNFPTDIFEPTKMDERTVGDVLSNTIPMQEVDYIPQTEQERTLRFWAWIGQSIVFLGATTDRIVHLYYIRDFAAPTTVEDNLPITLSESFLGARTAALASQSLRDFKNYELLNLIAEGNIDRLIRLAVKGQQNLPVRKRPFSFRNRRSVSF